MKRLQGGDIRHIEAFEKSLIIPMKIIRIFDGVRGYKSVCQATKKHKGRSELTLDFPISLIYVCWYVVNKKACWYWQGFVSHAVEKSW